jgi:hypothetical protein
MQSLQEPSTGPYPILYPVHTTLSYLFEIHYNVIQLTFNSTQTQRISQQEGCFLHNINVSSDINGVFSRKPTTENPNRYC